tara:strand:+ start:530 stop:2161 length:1632 start_codon:yes stop_codon:yes gene_type:complete
MAFKMNRPTIRGTANHKASIAKAKAESIVSQRRTQADASLVGASKAMGESYKPQAIDYSIKQKGIDFLDIKKESSKGKGKKKTKKDSNEIDVGSTADTYTGGFEEDNSDIKAPDVNYIKPKSDVRVMTPKELKNKNKKKKEKKPKVKKDTFYNDVDEDGNVISRAYQSIKDKIKAKREQNKLDFQTKQQEKNKIQAEKDAAYVGKGEIDDPETNYKNTKEYKEDKKKQDDAAKLKAEQEANKPITLDPRSIRSLPTSKQKLELQQSTGTLATTESTNRFEKAAEEFGYDLSTEKGYNEAEKAMEYNNRTDEWQNPKVAVDNLESKKQGPSEEEKRIEAEVAAEQAETMRLEKERQAEKKAIAENALAEKKAKKKAEIEEKNKGIRERNEARNYFKGKTNQPKTIEEKVEALRKMKAEQEEALNWQPEFEEQDDPDNFNENVASKQSEQELDKIAYKPQVVSDEVAEPVVEQNTTTTEKPKVSDFRTKKNPFGGTLTAKDQYEKALKKYYSKSPAQMRDNRIYRNAVKGGAVQRNMIKSGYKPE